eukprot:comp19739_c1_seq1/m.23543 comp19739_c1_seq1/g.23543  ORF comp19739_c1_seq1/g.23543 comp19739_c1_seq1/m.23543 type:complete len:194 (-) comp19739_c1_seq1:121-702(-)
MEQKVGQVDDFKESQRLRCEQQKVKSCVYSPLVKFMLQQMEKAGCEVEARHMVCIPCDAGDGTEGIAGGFNPDVGVRLCQDRIRDQAHMDRTLAHELIHMFDHCRAKVDWSDPHHHACSEIRAAALSGECEMKIEYMQTGKVQFRNGMRECVRRRALKSVQANPHFSKEVAEKALEEVFDRCYADSAPYAMHP